MSASINSIPASQLVNIIPSVLNAGGSALDLQGLALDSTNRIPVGAVLSFPTAAAISAYAGPTSQLYQDALVYFKGFNDSNRLPGSLLVTQYNADDVGAYLRGGKASQLTLTQLQALTGVLTVTIDGTPHTSSSIDLSTATSFSQAAQLITDALGLVGPTQTSLTLCTAGATFTGTGTGTALAATAVTGYISAGDIIAGTGVPGGTTIVAQTSGTPGGAGNYTTSAVTTASSASITATSVYLNFTGVETGLPISVGQEVTGTGVVAGTFIGGLNGLDGVTTGRYILNQAQQFASATMTLVMPVVTYDSISGAFVVISSTVGATSTIGFGSGTIAAPLFMTQATGAVTSQGAEGSTPGPFMDNILTVTQDWCTFWTIEDPDETGNDNKLLFAKWTDDQNKRYIYAVDDTDITPTESTAALSSLGNICKTNGYNGIVPNYMPAGNDLRLSAFVAGSIASVDFTEHNGRATLAYRGQDGLSVSVTNATIAANLIANGYNFYGAYATANQRFQEFQPGQISGEFEWIDSYYDQVWLNNAMQLALMELLVQVKSLPYNPAGYGLIRQALLDPILQAVNFGAIRTNVPLSNAQAAEVNNAAGLSIADTLQSVGWYLQILPALPQVRAARQSPPITLWYMDGESIQKIDMASVLVQ